MKKWIGVLGYPLTHSLSKSYHEENLRRAGLDWEFRVLEWEPSTFEKKIVALKKETGCVGFSVTMPFKEAIVPYMDSLDLFSQQSGVVNGLKSVSGVWHGFNTDGPGFLDCFKFWNPLPPKNVQIIFLGAGATARSLSIALAQRGYRSFLFVNRHIERAQRWKETFQSHFPDTHVGVLAWGGEIPKENIFLINTTPLRDERMDWIPVAELPRPAWIFDVTYHPDETRLLERGRRRCCFTMNGWPMFRAQADRAFAAWTQSR